MGYAAATNIYQQILEKEINQKPKFLEIEQFDNRMALAVGKEAVVYAPGHGLNWGKASMDRFFGDDLGYSSTLNLMSLLIHLFWLTIDTVAWDRLGLGSERANKI